MPIFLDTHGKTKIAIGICARCSIKMPYSDLVQDPNYPGLYVCQDDLDQFDPYRLPARATEDITLDHARPDVSLTTFGTVPIYAAQYFNLTGLNPTHPWQANTFYQQGDTITPLNVDAGTTTLPQPWFVAVVPGTSGATAPTWPTQPGVLFGDYIELVSDDFRQLLSDNGLILLVDGNGDGTVTWLCLGIYPN